MTAAVWIGNHIYLMSLARYKKIAGNSSVHLFATFKFNLKAEIAETIGRG